MLITAIEQLHWIVKNTNLLDGGRGKQQVRSQILAQHNLVATMLIMEDDQWSATILLSSVRLFFCLLSK